MLKLVALCLVALVAADYYDYDAETRKGMLGTRLDMRGSMTQGAKIYEMTEMEALNVEASIPSSYDSAAAHPQCANTINFIKDQAACGSCWAVAASSMLADRFCISCGYGAGSNNNQATANMAGQVPNEAMPGFVLAAEELMSCCRYCGDGCQGGYPIDAMRRAYITGFVSGGWYNSQCGCQTYQIAPIRQSLQPTPQCKATCDNTNYPENPMTMDRHKAKSYRYVRGQRAMQKAIMGSGSSTGGPLECAFTVYQSFEDFFRDPSNAKKVYTGPRNNELGGHAIKITGWGQQMQDGKMVKYWQIHNSWNATWGDNGQFKYIRGNNFAGMEEGCVDAVPMCSNNMKPFDALQCKGRDY